MPHGATAAWTAVLALKPLTEAKSRLSAQLTVEERAALAIAMAADVVSAALSSPRIERCLVVTADRFAGRMLGRLGATRVIEPEPTGLNAAYRLGQRLVLDSGGRRMLLLMADLPQCRPEALTAFLGLVGDEQAGLVSDAEGVGTTALAAPDAGAVRPDFGPDSRARHVGQGIRDLSGAVDTGLRHDVDSYAGLTTLSDPGAATSAWLRAHSATTIKEHNELAAG